MNCSQCQELLAACIDDGLEASQRAEFAEHLAGCAACRREADECRRLHDRLARDAASGPQTRLEAAVMGRIVQEQTFTLRRIAMRKRYGKIGLGGLGVAAAVAVAAVLFVPWGDSSDGRATAAEVFASAIEALSDLRSVYIKLDVRTRPNDNFDAIGLDCDFVTHEMWKEFGDPPSWRIEKPGRVVVMDGRSTLMLTGACGADQGRCYANRAGPDCGFVSWLKPLLDVDQVLNTQLGMSNQIECTNLVFGGGQVVITIEAKAQGDFTHDWLKNKSIAESDHRRVYTFDARTHRLEDLEVWVHAEEGDVLVLDVNEIVYDAVLPDELFALEVPDDAIWYEYPEGPPTDDVYAALEPDQAARAFFEALADEDWEQVLRFAGLSEIPEEAKPYFGGLEIIRLGDPFQSGQYPGWFVPYEIRLRSGEVKRHNLAIRNDNPAQRWLVDGGIGL